jgi:hypothetical protein
MVVHIVLHFIPDKKFCAAAQLNYGLKALKMLHLKLLVVVTDPPITKVAITGHHLRPPKQISEAFRPRNDTDPYAPKQLVVSLK